MPRYDVRCEQDHVCEVVVAWDDRHTPCVICGAPTERVWASGRSAAVVGDDIPGGQVIENLGHQAMTFYSKNDIVEEADRRGLRLRDQWAGPGDKHLTNWAAGIDAQTLDNARVLLTRVRAVRDADPAVLQSLQTSVGAWEDA